MKKYENFCKALGNLQDINNYSAPYDNVATVGLVGLYSICFEQSWKAGRRTLKNSLTYVLRFFGDFVHPQKYLKKIFFRVYILRKKPST